MHLKPHKVPTSIEEQVANLQNGAFGTGSKCGWCFPCIQPTWGDQRDQSFGYRLAATDEELVSFNAALASTEGLESPRRGLNSPVGIRGALGERGTGRTTVRKEANIS